MSKYLNIFVCAVFAFRYRHKANITWQLEHSKIIIRLNTTRILVRLQQLPATCKLLQLPLNWNSLDEVAEEGSGGTSKASAFATLIIDRMTWLRISASLDMIFSWMDFNASKHSSWNLYKWISYSLVNIGSEIIRLKTFFMKNDMGIPFLYWEFLPSSFLFLCSLHVHPSQLEAPDFLAFVFC